MPTWQYDKSVRTTRRELWHVARRACVGNSYVTNARNTNGRPAPVWAQDVHQNGHFLIHYSSIPRASFGVDFAEPSASDACPWPRDSRDLGRQWCCLMSRTHHQPRSPPYVCGWATPSLASTQPRPPLWWQPLAAGRAAWLMPRPYLAHSRTLSYLVAGAYFLHPVVSHH